MPKTKRKQSADVAQQPTVEVKITIQDFTTSTDEELIYQWMARPLIPLLDSSAQITPLNSLTQKTLREFAKRLAHYHAQEGDGTETENAMSSLIAHGDLLTDQVVDKAIEASFEHGADYIRRALAEVWFSLRADLHADTESLSAEKHRITDIKLINKAGNYFLFYLFCLSNQYSSLSAEKANQYAYAAFVEEDIIPSLQLIVENRQAFAEYKFEDLDENLRIVLSSLIKFLIARKEYYMQHGSPFKTETEDHYIQCYHRLEAFLIALDGAPAYFQVRAWEVNERFVLRGESIERGQKENFLNQSIAVLEDLIEQAKAKLNPQQQADSVLDGLYYNLLFSKINKLKYLQIHAVTTSQLVDKRKVADEIVTAGLNFVQMRYQKIMQLIKKQQASASADSENAPLFDDVLLFEEMAHAIQKIVNHCLACYGDGVLSPKKTAGLKSKFESARQHFIYFQPCLNYLRTCLPLSDNASSSLSKLEQDVYQYYVQLDFYYQYICAEEQRYLQAQQFKQPVALTQESGDQWVLQTMVKLKDLIEAEENLQRRVAKAKADSLTKKLQQRAALASAAFREDSGEKSPPPPAAEPKPEKLEDNSIENKLIQIFALSNYEKIKSAVQKLLREIGASNIAEEAMVRVCLAENELGCALQQPFTLQGYNDAKIYYQRAKTFINEIANKKLLEQLIEKKDSYQQSDDPTCSAQAHKLAELCLSIELVTENVTSSLAEITHIIELERSKAKARHEKAERQYQQYREYQEQLGRDPDARYHAAQARGECFKKSEQTENRSQLRENYENLDKVYNSYRELLPSRKPKAEKVGVVSVMWRVKKSPQPQLQVAPPPPEQHCSMSRSA